MRALRTVQFGSRVSGRASKRYFHTSLAIGSDFQPHHVSPGTTIKKAEPSFGLFINDVILDCARKEFEGDQVGEKRAEWRISSKADFLTGPRALRAFGGDTKTLIAYTSDLPRVIAKELKLELRDVLSRLKSRLAAQTDIVRSVSVNTDRLTLAIEIQPKFSYSRALRSGFCHAATNRGFPAQYGVEIINPTWRIGQLKIDMVRPIQTASFVHAVMAQQRQRPLAPLSIRIPNSSSLEFAMIVSFAQANKVESFSGWSDVIELSDRFSRLARTDSAVFDAKSTQVLQRIQSVDNDAGDATRILWRSLEGLVFEQLSTDLALASPEILPMPESLLIDDARTIFEAVRSQGIATKADDGSWVVTPPNAKPIAIAQGEVLLQPLFDLAAFCLYLRESNVLLPRRILAVGRSSSTSYVSFLKFALEKLEFLQPLAAWIDFVPVASTSFVSSEDKASPASLDRIIAETRDKCSLALQAVASTARAQTPRPAPRVSEATALISSNWGDEFSRFEEQMLQNIPNLARLSLRFRSLIADRESDLKLTANAVFETPRGGLISIFRVLYSLNAQDAEVPKPNSGATPSTLDELALDDPHGDISNLCGLLLQIPDVIRQSEDESNSRRVARHLLQLSSAAEATLIVQKHSRRLIPEHKARLVACTCAGMERLLVILRCEL